MDDQFEDTSAAVAAYLNPIQNDPATAAKVSMSVALDSKPDFEAELRKAAQRTGVPIDAARAYPEDVKKQATLSAYNFDDMAQQFPATVRFLADPENARIAHDDTDNLSAFEKTLGLMKNTGKALGSSVPQFNASMWGLAQVGVETLIQPVTGALTGTILPEDIGARMAGQFAKFRREQEGVGSSLMPKTNGIVDAGFYSGVQSLGQNLLTLPAAVLSGQPELMLYPMAAQSGGQAYGQARDKGVSVPGSLAFGTSQAVIEYATEKLPMGLLIKDLKVGAPFYQTLMHQMASEVPGEQIATLLQDMNEWAVLHPEAPFSDYLKERPSAAAQTLIATMVATGGQVTTMKGLQVAGDRISGRTREAERAAQDADILGQLNELAAASKLRQRDPDSFQAFIRQAAEDGPVQNVYINAATFAQSLGEQLPQVVAASPAIAEQLQKAIATGGDLRIPVDEFAAKIAGTDFAQSILPHLKTDPAGMTQAEAQTFMQSHAEELRAEVERTLEAKGQDDAFKQSRDQVTAQMAEQLKTAGRFTDEVNTAYASMLGNFYSVMAARLGITPTDMMQRYPLQVAVERLAGAKTLDQQAGGPPGQAAGPFGPVFDQFKGDAAGAIAHLKEQKAGEAIGALTHPEIGHIDLVWGKEGTGASDGYGLAKLLKWHPEVVDNLQSVLDDMTVTSRSKNRVILESTDHKAAVSLDWFGAEKTWLLTAYGRREQKGSGSGTTIDTAKITAEDDTARLNTASENSLAQPSDELNKLLQGNRGSITFGTDITQQPSVITLLEKADLSTFLHESGHFFLEVINDIAGRPDAPEQIKQDMDAALRWFGVPDLATWNSYDLEQKRPYHEQFARGFEAYLFEGNAPNVELQGVFQRFRAWMLNVYQSLTALNVTLNDEVRSVFDRMLASSEAIAEAEQARNFAPLFKNAEAAGMTPEEWTRYQDLGMEATQEAIHELERRSLRDMQWLSNAKSRLLSKLQADARDKRKAVRREVEAEVMAEPVNQVRQFLKRGEVTVDGEQVKATEGHKLSITALEEMYPESALNSPEWKKLGYGNFGMLGKEGLHPDMVAEMFGFDSGDQLVRTLLDAENPRDKIEGLTDQRMLERYGDLTDPDSIAKAADTALHNDARARFVATELNALNKATGQRKVLASAAKAFAEATIARQKVRDLRPSQYAAAEARAAKAAAKAQAASDLAVAATEKRNQLINNYATKAALNAQDEVQKAVDYLRKFDREGARKSLDADYLDQIDALLERFDLRKGQPLKAIDKRTALAAWIESQREQGLEPDIPPDLVNEAFRKSYRDMTVEELRGLRDTVKQIEHLGRLKHKLLTAKDQRAYEAIRDEIAASIQDNAGDRTADTRTPTTSMGRTVQGLRRFWAAHVKVATWARVMDGGKDGGPVWEYFIRNANEAGDRETQMRTDAIRALSEILDPVFKLGKMGGKGTFFPTINRSLNRESRIAIALNTGNESNLQRLLGGEGWARAQIQPVLDSLTKAEWDAVQAIWDHFESYRPQIAAKERRIYGKEPEWVQPSPVLTPHGEYRGGYYPVKYDPAASQRAEEHADAEGAKRQLQGAYTSATTRRSFTKSRADEVVGRPLLYSLAGLYSGVNEVIHDLSWHEWLIDVNRLLRSNTIDGAIRNHYGPEVKAQFKSWVADVAEGEKAADNAGEVALGKLRQNVSAAGLGYNVMSAALQGLGLTQSIVRVGAPWIARGIQQYLAHPLDATRTVNEKSDFMAGRSRTRYRELNELRNRVQGESSIGNAIKENAYLLMMRCQQVVDTPTWLGAYEKAISSGEEEARAIALADQAVIDAQGGGQTKDLAAIERGGNAMKLFTSFYSFMNTALNIGVAQSMTAKSKGKLAVDYLLLYSVPPVLGMLLKDAFTPGDGGDDDWEKLARKLIGEQIGYLMGLMVVTREFAEVARNMVGANDRPRDYAGPAGVRLITDTFNFGKQASQGEFDDAFRKAAVNLMGDMTGLPSAQINRTVTGAQALAEGETANPASIAFGFQRKR